MPRDTSIKSVLVIGSGPIVIGQACEFDYSGTQACRVLRAEGIRVVLVNSNPATIMTEPEFADATYIEPITPEFIERIIAKERPDAVLATLGGQTALNAAIGLHKAGTLQRYGAQLIGADVDAIERGENREIFRTIVEKFGGESAKSIICHTLEEVIAGAAILNYPVVVRPSFTMGGLGSGIAFDEESLRQIAGAGLRHSPTTEVLLEESILGWKEYELEVMRDRNDNCVIICSIENVDAMGVHTGDSITVAPAMTLSDVEYQKMRDAAFACIRRVGVETGGSNVQFAVNPATGEQVVIEMNPRVSRSSALASKATGFPIAKIAAKLAVGYTLDEISNDITKKTPASFEPTIDYVVVKIPRWAFEKFPGTSGVLGTQMQSVGEAMAIGRTFTESLQKALRSLEIGRFGLNCDPGEENYLTLSDEELLRQISIPTPERIFQIGECLRRKITIEIVAEHCHYDPWFLDQMLTIVEEREFLAEHEMSSLTKLEWLRAKRIGFADAQLAWLWKTTEAEVRASRLALGVRPTYKAVDTCSAEFSAQTPYHYSTYEDESEIHASTKESVIILGSGPNRIGQGIEFDYCCVHASFALRDAGFETIMLNCNPETVSTDYDTSDKLYFEPLTLEDVLNVIEAETVSSGVKPKVIVGLGGQTPLKLAARIPADLIAGTNSNSIDIAEDREKWSALCEANAIAQPPGGTARNVDQAVEIAEKIGYPVLVRPSYVLGGRAMQIVHDETQLKKAMQEMDQAGSLGREGGLSAERPVLVDRFLEDAIEVDVDAIRDASAEILIGGVMEHVEQAGVHSGDSACTIPPVNLSSKIIDEIETTVKKIANALNVIGLINVQFAVAGSTVYVIEANPRASRTVPFVAKATGVQLVKVASRVMLGATLAQLRQEGLVPERVSGGHVSVKEAVLPFNRFAEVDTALGPEMRSTGEVMGIDDSFARAFAKAQFAAGTTLPESGLVFVSLNDRDKSGGVEVVKGLSSLGLQIAATSGTAKYLTENGCVVTRVVSKFSERKTPDKNFDDAVKLIEAGEIVLVINTPHGYGTRSDGEAIRKSANNCRVSVVTTLSAAQAAVQGMIEQRNRPFTVKSLQEFHAR